MNFKDLKNGYQVFFLNTENSLSVSTGKVVNITTPHFDMSRPAGQMSNMVVDVTVENLGETKTYTVNENSTITCASPTLMLSPDRDCILREVENRKAQAQEIINARERNEKIVEDADKILTEWNPAFREKKETENRFAQMDNKIDKLASAVEQLIAKLE